MHSKNFFFETPSKTLIYWAFFVSCRVPNPSKIIKLNTVLFGRDSPLWKDMTIFQIPVWLDKRTTLSNQPTSTIFSLLKWIQTYLLIHPGKYCGSKIMKFLRYTRNCLVHSMIFLLRVWVGSYQCQVASFLYRFQKQSEFIWHIQIKTMTLSIYLQQMFQLPVYFHLPLYMS